MVNDDGRRLFEGCVCNMKDGRRFVICNIILLCLYFILI